MTLMSSSREISLALVQMSCAEEPAKNLDKAVSRIADAAAKGAQIISLQELFGSRYFCQANDKKFFELAEPVPGPSTETLSKIAKEKKLVVVASLFEKDGQNFYNTACVIDADGRFLGKYRKVHIPDDLPNHYSELFYFKPGDLGTPVFETKFGKIGVQVCWDQWFPEGARSLALQGAEIIFYPTAIGWPKAQRDQEIGKAEFDAWVTVQRGHAISNTVFVVATNRTGLEDHLDFWGGSFVADPLGRILKQASHDKEETLIVPCRMTEIEEVRQDWPFLTCRRTDQYSLK
jgi:N-carbamoylputrescine amidase